MTAVRISLAVFCSLVLAARGAAQEPAATGQIAPEVLLDFNRGISAFLAGDPEGAEGHFDAVLAKQPDATTAIYYRGLVRLDHGLRIVKGILDTTPPDEAAGMRAAASERFRKASEDLNIIVSATDPTVRTYDAALFLGIAQLARDQDPESAESLQLNERARDTLAAYVAQTPEGASDRLGFFYLAVAYYRLSDEYTKRGEAAARRREDTSVFAESARQNILEVSSNLEKSLDRARIDLQAQRMDAGDFEYFEAVSKYYQALVAIQQRNNSAALPLLREVEAKGFTPVSDNATGIIERVEKLEAENPSRIPIESPFGTLDFEAEFEIGNGYDTNVILLGDNTRLPYGITKQQDYQFGVRGGFTVSRYITRDEAPIPGESLLIGLSGYTEHVWQPSIGEFDLNTYVGRAFVNWQFAQDWFLGLQYDYSYTFLGHSPFISSNRLSPVLSKIWRGEAEPGAAPELGEETGRTDVFYTYDIRDYLDRVDDFRLNRDGIYHQLGASHTFNLARWRDMKSWFGYTRADPASLDSRWLNFYLGYVYRDERTVGDEFDLWGHSIITGLDFPLPYRFAFEFDAEFSWDDYNQPSIFDFRRNERSDFIQRYDFGLTHTLVARGESPQLPTLEIKLRGGVALTFADSNIWDRLHERIYEYDRAVYGLSLSVGF